FMKLYRTHVILVIGIGISSCSKEENTPTPTAETPTTTPTPTPTLLDPCNGDDGFCMNYGSVTKSGSANLFVINGNRVRVYWEKGSSTTFEQVELDIYSLTPGTYSINGTDASLEYYSAAGGAVSAAYGSVTVSALDTITGVTGTFTATMQDSTVITSSVFKNIKK
ncbi:MAG: hypothetical protein HS119_14150, partial [Flavobacteriales bacterium]|nr:hypothetical protein [Flavobacteriales bacterium]